MYLNVETELNLKGVVKGVDLDVDPWVYSLGAKYRF
jgi:outer membrane protein W